MACMKQITAAQNRAVIDTLFEKGNIQGAGWHRQGRCAHANDCGYFCDWLRRDGDGPWYCGHPEAEPAVTEDLLNAYKRRNAQCPVGHW